MYVQSRHTFIHVLITLSILDPIGHEYGTRRSRSMPFSAPQRSNQRNVFKKINFIFSHSIIVHVRARNCRMTRSLRTKRD